MNNPFFFQQAQAHQHMYAQPRSKIDYHTPPIQETLHINSWHGGSQKTIDRFDPATGTMTPVWAVNKGDRKCIAITYANAPAVSNAPPVGTIFKHSWSEKIDISVRGGPPFQMKVKDDDYPIRRYDWWFNGVDFTWTMDDNCSGHNVRLVDKNTGTLLARYMAYPNGSRAGKQPVFEMYIPPTSIDMDMFIVTAMACVDMWKTDADSGLAAWGAYGGFSSRY